MADIHKTDPVNPRLRREAAKRRAEGAKKEAKENSDYYEAITSDSVGPNDPAGLDR